MNAKSALARTHSRPQLGKEPTALSKKYAGLTDGSRAESNVIDLPDDGAGLIDGKEWPLIPPGTYSATFLHHETGKAFNVPRVYLHFKIVDLGPHCGVILYRAYRVKSISGKRIKNGAFRVPRNGDFVREMAAILNLHRRLDRISPSMLRGCVVRIEVEEVAVDYRQRQLAPALRYSVVRRLICIEAGKGSHQ